MCGVCLVSSAGSSFHTHVFIASDGVILRGVQRSSLVIIAHTWEGEPGDETTCATSVC